MFTDASQEAYGAVAYLRYEYQSGDTTVRFVMSTAKVTPLQSISVPRLELMAAIVGLRIAETVGQTTGLSKEKWTLYFTGYEDIPASSSLLYQIELGKYRWKPIPYSGATLQPK